MGRLKTILLWLSQLIIATPLFVLLVQIGMAAPNVTGVKAQGFDDHSQAHSSITHAQLTFFLSCLFAAAFWVVRLPRFLHKNSSENKGEDIESATPSSNAAHSENAASLQSDSVVSRSQQNDVKKETVATAAAPPSPNVPPTPTIDEALRDVIIFGGIMFYFFLCDYIKAFPEEPRIYNRDQFLFLLFLLFLVGCAFTIQPAQDKILNRDQTEEWKGWMQVMFVWYHYFAAKEFYNWIRVYIACYVWMTGFGNFSFFWVKGDYSLWRVLKMLFRMNFLVIAVVVVTANEYMLYYICAMHTYWFLTVYVFMRVLTSWNTHRWKMAAKFLAYIVCNALVFEIPGMASKLFRPVWFLFQYHDGKYDIMHEWEFRAGLDHWACLCGMLCAYNYPHYEAFIKYLETGTDKGSQGAATKLYMKLGMLGVALVAGFAWYFSFMGADKFTYNATHCYTSLIPILVYIVVRNICPILRRYHIGLFVSLGKITLETYLSQLHVYLQSNAKHLIGYIPGYPLLNFALATIVYLTISQHLFRLTLSFSAFFIQKEWRKGARMVLVALAIVSLSFCASLALKALYGL